MFSGDDVRRVMGSLQLSDDVSSSLLVRRSSAGLVKVSDAKEALRKMVMNRESPLDRRMSRVLVLVVMDMGLMFGVT